MVLKPLGKLKKLIKRVIKLQLNTTSTTSLRKLQVIFLIILVCRQEHNSKYEIYKTDSTREADIENVDYKCEVMKFEDFVRRLITIKEKYKNPSVSQYLAGEKLFFFRQIYCSDDTFYPDALDTSCYCDKIFNPDKNFIQCKECKELIHVECFISAETQKCSKCHNNIANQLNTGTTSATDTPTTFLKMKRPHTDELPPNPRIEKKAEVNIEEKKHEEHKANYPNLSEDRRKYLTRLIDRLDKENTCMHNVYLNPEDKSRKIIRDKISYSLLYGVEELKETGYWKKMKTEALNKEHIPELSAISLCKDLAVAIESAIYFQNDKSIVIHS
jgi:hypothetical protein